MKRNQDLDNAEPLSEIEMKRIYANTMGKIEHARRRLELPHAIKVAILLIVSVVALGSVATATYHWRGAIARMFARGDKIPKEKMIQNENTTIADEKLAVTVKQIVGDKYGCYIWVDVKNKMETPLDEIGTPAFETVTMVTEDREQLICSKETYFGVDKETYSLLYHVSSEKPVTGKVVTMTISNIGYRDLDRKDTFTKTNEGKYQITLEMKYEDNSTIINVNKQVTSGEKKVMLESICISPFSATLQLSGSCSFVRIPYVVQFMDGTLTNSEYAKSYDIYGSDSTITMLFNKVVEVTDIESITFGNVTIPVTKNVNPITRVCYVNEDMHLNISMTKRLYQMASWKLDEPKRDSEFGTKVQVLHCIGTMKGSTMPLFAIYRIEGEMTEDEMNEKNPMIGYMRSYHGYTYAIQYGEATDEKQIDIFSKVMNEDVLTLVPWIELMN